MSYFELPGQDSNLDKESQNLLCYRYTTGYQARRFQPGKSPSTLAGHAHYKKDGQF